ncbi:tryptophan-rich sensory protein [Spirosoma endbachense]|uniref:Tryptophan-rich sensory protein n=1 Tax=Spirosoma endbachense TaxID=2666025 RepID=A0A6P1W9J1_9BACT|nr:tryptophan-rich sensory protein [Spirosoma endbachense]QHW00397.1 hypothetical protein GJR95_37615 [Spirosoma endbachense]
MKSTSFVEVHGGSVNGSSTGSRPIYVLVFFSIGTLGIGMLTAYLSFSLFPFDNTYRLPAIYPPQWMFWVFWLVLYPTMGLAAGYVWLQRNTFDIRGAMIYYVSILLTNVLFLPIANVSKGNPAIMTFMDINGVLTAVLLGWLFLRYSKRAFYYLLPLIIWMPVTTTFKILLWLANSTNP